MSEQTVIEDPFAPAPLDEETELRALVKALELAEGFKLIFARCNQIEQRNRLIEEARARLLGRNVQLIRLTEPTDHLLDTLRSRLADPPPDVLFVTGLEYSLPDAAEASATRFVANLNASRNSFSQLDRPLVLWVSQYILSAITLGAPDFFSVRSGIYFFTSTPVETSTFADSLISGSEAGAENLTLAEKNARIYAIKSLIADYNLLPDEERNKTVEMRLHMRLGTFLYSTGQFSSALKHYERSLELARELSDRKNEAWSLSNIGVVYDDTRDTQKAVESLKQALDIARSIGDQLGVADSLCNLGNVYWRQGNRDKAKAIYQQALDIYRELSKEQAVGAVLGNLGVVYEVEGNLSEAESAYMQSAEIARKLRDRRREASAVYNLGRMYISLGRIKEAETALSEAQKIAHELGEKTIEKYSAEYLGHLQEEKNQ